MSRDAAPLSSATPPDLPPDPEPEMSLLFPSYPRALSDALNVIGQAMPDAQALLKAVQRDGAVKQRLLRRANLQCFGTGRKIEDVDKAIILLGLREVSNVLFLAAVRKAFPRPSAAAAAAVHAHILRLGVATALFGQLLGDRVDRQGEGSVFAAGVVRQLGRFVMLFSQPDDYSALWLDVADGNTDFLSAPSPERETDLFGLSSTEIGISIGIGWGLPYNLVGALAPNGALELTEEGDASELAVIVAAGLSGAVALYEPFNVPAGLPAPISAFAQAFGLEPSAVRDLLAAEGGAIRKKTEALLDG